MQAPRWIPSGGRRDRREITHEYRYFPTSSTCYVYAETFKLLPHSLGRTLIGLNPAQVVQPNIDAILKPDEQDMLQAQFSVPASLQKVDDRIKEGTRNNNRPGLGGTTVLSDRRAVGPNPSRTTTYWIDGLSIFSLTIVSFYCYYHRHLISKLWRELCVRMTQRQRPHPSPWYKAGRGTRLSSKCNSPMTTEIPLHVIATDEAEGAVDRETAQLKPESRAPTPLCAMRSSYQNDGSVEKQWRGAAAAGEGDRRGLDEQFDITRSD
jgi:hypothetical protein